MKIIDTHIHIWTEKDPKYPMHVPKDQYPWWEGDINEAVTDMEKAGITGAVIVQIPYHKYDHSYALLAKNTYPGKFAVVGNADLLSPDIGDILSKLKKQCIQGVRVSAGTDEFISDKASNHLWMAAAELNFPIILYIYPCHYREVYRIAEEYPKIRLLLDHMANISFVYYMKKELQMLKNIAVKQNIYIKASHLFGLGRNNIEEKNIKIALKELKDTYGAERIMFGSNWPLVRSSGGLEMCVNNFIKAIDSFSKQEKESILSNTAESLYDF